MNTWFGESWGAACCDELPRVETPVGSPCLWCEEPIAPGDCGMGCAYFGEAGAERRYYHLECWSRTLLGSVAHQLKVCPCYGGPYPDTEPDFLSKRDGAKAAHDLAFRLRGQSPE